MTRLLLLAGLNVTAWTAAPVVAVAAAVVAIGVCAVCVLELVSAVRETNRKLSKLSR
jgi:hypothetical protein